MHVIDNNMENVYIEDIYITYIVNVTTTYINTAVMNAGDC